MATAENLESLKKQYGEAIVRRMERRKRLQKIMVFISVVAFLGMTSSRLGGMFKKAFEPSGPSQAEQVEAAVSQLERQEKGYEAVLQREPENQMVLESLVRVRLEQNKLVEAIGPLEKLVELYPDREDYRGLLKQLKSDTKSAGEK